MIALIEKQTNRLLLICDTETSEELSEYKTFEELISVCVPGLTPTDNPDTAAPIYFYQERVWWVPDYLIFDPLENLRDNFKLYLETV